MLLWVVLAALTGLVLAALLRPLARGRSERIQRDEYGLRVYRDQLAGLRQDEERGVLSPDEAAGLRLEIERRLLAAARGRDAATTPAPRAGRLGGGIAMAVVLCAVPAVALTLYLTLGQPDIPDAPLAARGLERKLLSHDGTLDLQKARTALQDRLAKEPDSLEGWLLLGRTDATLARWSDARADFAHALDLSKRSAEALQDYGEVLVGEADGTITGEAAGIFKEAADKSPTAYEARYDLALAEAQQGDFPKALADWRALEHDAPPDAKWLPALREAIANLDQAAKTGPLPAAPSGVGPGNDTGPGGPMAGAIMNLPPGERLDAIRGMVAGLAARLQEHPDDLAGWTRLGRSYLVLGDPAKSADAYAKAMALAPQDPDLALGRAQALRAAAAGTTPGAAQGTAPDTATLADTGDLETRLDGNVIDAYRKVAALAPDQPEALWYLGLAARQRGDLVEARSDWTKLLNALDPSTPAAQNVKKQLATLSAGQ